MIELLKFLGFTTLFFRYVVWIASSLETLDKKWKKVVFGQIVEGFLLLFFFQQLFGRIHILPLYIFFTQLIGFFLTMTGVALAFLAKQQLGKAWVYAAAYKIVPQQQLLTDGVYGFIRHPIYVGIALSYIGIELLAGSWLWIAFLFFFFPLYVQAKKEETLLEKHFGKRYIDYQQHTKMFIPFVL